MSWIWHTTCREVELGIASDCRFVKNFKTERTNDSDKLIIYKPSRSQLSLILEILAINPRETRFGSGTQVKPCRSGSRTGWLTYSEYRRGGPYVVLFFLLLLLCESYGVIFKSVLKSIFSGSAFRKKNLKHKYVSASHDFIILRSVVQSWNFAHFDLYIGGEARSKLINLGFPQCKTNSSGDFRGKRQGFDGN